MFWRNAKWSSIPGCFERHLQRRQDNPLFPIERRKISKAEVVEAQKWDQSEQDHFIALARSLGTELENSEKIKPGSTIQDSTCLQKVQDLLELAAAIGGNVQNTVQMLESTEAGMIQQLNQQMPDGADLLRQGRTLSTMRRIPFIAQSTRKNSPILSGEEVPTLLSEKPETISLIGQISRSLPDFKPNTGDVKANLDAAVKEGFDRKKASALLNAWNQAEQ